jgi:hypothetical protein
VSKQDKPDPARGWLFVEKLLAEEESARLARASDEEVDRRMAELKVEPSRIPSAEELLARAMEHAAKRATGGDPASGAKVKPLPVRPRGTPWLSWLAAAAIGGLVVAVVMDQREKPVAHPRPHDDAGQQEPTAQERAARMREEAFMACRKRRWEECERRLDEAKRLDPAGDADPLVQQAHEAAIGGLYPEAGLQDRDGKAEQR